MRRPRRLRRPTSRSTSFRPPRRCLPAPLRRPRLHRRLTLRAPTPRPARADSCCALVATGPLWIEAPFAQPDDQVAALPDESAGNTAVRVNEMAIGMAHFQQVTSYGQRYWCVTVGVKNLSDDEDSHNTFEFSLLHSLRELQSATFPIFNDSSSLLGSGGLAPDGTAAGVICFDQPRKQAAGSQWSMTRSTSRVTSGLSTTSINRTARGKPLTRGSRIGESDQRHCRLGLRRPSRRLRFVGILTLTACMLGAFPVPTLGLRTGQGPSPRQRTEASVEPFTGPHRSMPRLSLLSRLRLATLMP